MAQVAAPSRHPLASLTGSPARSIRAARIGVAVLGVALGASHLYQYQVGLLRGPSMYIKDFSQEYTLARATLDGGDPYAPIATLASRYMGVSFPALSRELLNGGPPPVPTADTSEFGNHPTPHPPTVALVSLPLGLMSFETAAAVWLGFELLCLLATLWLLARADRVRLSTLGIAGAAVVLALWGPISAELSYGQLTLPSLALLAAARLAQARGRPALAGALLGAAILLKPTPWPIVLLLLAHRQWRLVASSVATLALGFAVAAAALGPGTILRYVAEVLPAVNRIYATSFHNVSLWSVGSRLFQGTRAIAGTGFDSPPLVDAPALAGAAAAALPLALLALAVIWAWRRPGVDLCIGVGAALSAVLSPIAWSFYALLALIAAWQIALSIHRRGYPRRETNWLLLAGTAFAANWPSVAEPYVSPTLAANGSLALSFAPAQIQLAWTVSILTVAGLAVLLGARGLIVQPAPAGRFANDGGPIPTGTSGSLFRPGRFPRLVGPALEPGTSRVRS